MYNQRKHFLLVFLQSISLRYHPKSYTSFYIGLYWCRPTAFCRYIYVLVRITVVPEKVNLSKMDPFEATLSCWQPFLYLVTPVQVMKGWVQSAHWQNNRFWMKRGNVQTPCPLCMRPCKSDCAVDLQCNTTHTSNIHIMISYPTPLSPLSPLLTTLKPAA